MHAPLCESATLHGMGRCVAQPGVGLNALLCFTAPCESMHLEKTLSTARSCQLEIAHG